jgi:hypothetical protein
MRKSKFFGEQLKDSPLQKLMCCGSNAPAYIRDVQQENDADTAAEQLFACLPTSSVPKKKHFSTFRILKKERSCTAHMICCSAVREAVVCNIGNFFTLIVMLPEGSEICA